MEKKISWIIGCILAYAILIFAFDAKIINTILFAAGLVYLIWKNNR